MDMNLPATNRQTFALYCATGKDFRSFNLTAGVASAVLQAISPLRGQKANAYEVAMKLIAGESVAVPTVPQAPTPEQIYNEAHSAGMAAGNAASVVPMLVGHPSTPMGNDVDPNQKTWFVPDGVCGFAWVRVRPNSGKFVKWCKDNKIGYADSYAGGYAISCHEFGQSMQRKESYTAAFARILNFHGINANMESRID